MRVNVEQAVNAEGGEEAESQGTGTAGDYHASVSTFPSRTFIISYGERLSTTSHSPSIV